MTNTSTWYAVSKQDSRGFRYADLHKNVVKIGDRIQDTYGYILHVIAIEKINSKELANSRVRELRRDMLAYNYAKDNLFVNRGDRRENRNKKIKEINKRIAFLRKTIHHAASAAGR